MSDTEDLTEARRAGRRADFDRILSDAEYLLSKGQASAAAALAEVASTLAWMNPLGLFVSERLESLLGSLSLLLPQPGAHPTGHGGRLNVLHVATQVYQTGGPTQAIASWIEQDRFHRHSLLLTRQGAVPLPSKLVALVSAFRCQVVDGGGWPANSLMRRASALRELASHADVVLLHSHPNDVVPSIAFAGLQGSPPIVYVNHGDHVFWVGVAIADLVMNMRESGAAVSITRRGVEPSRSVIMPRPLRLARRTRSRAAAKRELGIPAEDVLIATAADGAKYRPIGSTPWIEMITPAILDDPHLRLLAAGPSPRGPWAKAERVTHGRVRALGLLPDVSGLLQAADIYVDSYPFTSLTSILEAGHYGTPVVALRSRPDQCAVLGADTPAVDEFWVQPRTAYDLQVAVSELSVDPARRESLGSATAAAIRDTHTGDGWTESATALYSQALSMRGRPRIGATLDADELDRWVDLIMDRTGYSQGVQGATMYSLGVMPVRARMSAWSSARSVGADVGLKELLPDSWLPILARLRTRGTQSRGGRIVG